MSLETTILDIIDGKKKAPLLFPLLRACSLAYGSGVALRHFAYGIGLFKSHPANAFVVSVGNIACGGTGKTPFVKFLAQALKDSHRVAILSRGYRSAAEHQLEPLLVTSESAEVCGDEPHVLASSIPEALVFTGKRRLKAAKKAEECGASIIILDDGMQYRQLKRDVEIVMVDGQDLFAGGRLLPAGRLRDFPSRLKTADLIVVNHADEHLDYEQKLKAFTDAPVMTIRTYPKVQNGDPIEGRKVGVFCALGRADRFIEAIRHLARDVVGAMAAPDHMKFSDEDLRDFAALCRKKGAEALVCSAKDAIKLPAQLSLEIPLIIVDAEVEILHGHDVWNRMIDRINEKRKSP